MFPTHLISRNARPHCMHRDGNAAEDEERHHWSADEMIIDKLAEQKFLMLLGPVVARATSERTVPFTCSSLGRSSDVLLRLCASTGELSPPALTM